MESLTDAVEEAAWAYIRRIDEMGGAVAAIEAGYMQDEIEQASFEYVKAIEDGEKVIVGVNRYVEDEPGQPEVLRIDPALQASQVARTTRVRAQRDQAAVDKSLAEVEAAARGTQNVLVPMKDALRNMATLGEVSDVLREVFGVHQPGR